MFYQDILDSLAPSYGVLETDTIEIERTNGSNKISCQINGEELNIMNPNQHYYWSQNYIGLKCRIHKKDGTSYVKEYNIAHLEKKINGWTYLTKKRIEKVKKELREMNGIKVDLINSNSGFLIKDLEEILKKKPKKRGRKPKQQVVEVEVMEPEQQHQTFSFEAFSDNSLKIAMAEYAELILTGHLPEEGIINKLIIAYKVDNQQKSSMMSALLKEVSNRWKS